MKVGDAPDPGPNCTSNGMQGGGFSLACLSWAACPAWAASSSAVAQAVATNSAATAMTKSADTPKIAIVGTKPL